MSFWGDLTTPEREALEAIGFPSRFRSGQVIFDQRDITQDVLILGSGFVKIVNSIGTGRDVVLALRGPGDIVGEMVGIAGGRRTATVVAVGPVEGLWLDRGRFAAFLVDYPHAAATLQRTLLQKLREADSDRVAASSMTVGQRLARLLLRLSQRYGAPAPGGGMSIGIALTQQDLAACVGGSPRAVARELESWRQRRLLSTGRRWVVVIRPDELRRIAGPVAPP